VIHALAETFGFIEHVLLPGALLHRFSTAPAAAAATAEEPIQPAVEVKHTQLLINGNFVDAASGMASLVPWTCRWRSSGSQRRVPLNTREDVPDAGPPHRRGHRARRRGRQRGHRPRRHRRPQGLRRGPVAEDDRLRACAQHQTLHVGTR